MSKHLMIMLIDASGSMAQIKEETESGVATLIEEQAQNRDETRVSLSEFTSVPHLEGGHLAYRVMYMNMPIEQVPAYRLHPTNGTPLYDAVARVVADHKDLLRDMPEKERPDRVTLVIATDGLENMSRHNTAADVERLLVKVQRPFKDDTAPKTQIHKRGWNVIYMGANQDAIVEAGKMGIGTGSSITYSNQSTEASYGVVSRAMTRSGLTGKSVAFTDDERAETIGVAETTP